MKAVLIILSLPLVSGCAAFGQNSSARDSAYYARLKTGEILFSSSLRLRGTADDNKYLSLDNGRKIAMSEVDRFYSPYGLFVTVPGSAGADIYRVDREGLKISLYSRVIYDPAASDYDPTTQTYPSGAYTRTTYFRKPGEVQMHTVTYASLMNALADHPESQRQVRIAKTRFICGGALMLASVLIEGIGLIQTGKMHAAHFVTTTGDSYPYTPTSTLVRGTGTSPLVYVGAGGIVGGIVLVFGARHHMMRAIDLYNGVPLE